jgi:hypothetical protein
MSQPLTMTELEAGLLELARSPKDRGILEMIVSRPAIDQRLVMERGELHLDVGLQGDNWLARGSQSTPDGSAIRDAQIAIMNSRVIQLLAQDRSRWSLAGDQIFVDMDLSEANLPAGQRLAIGMAVLEISARPHTGCEKFTSRFGLDAFRFVNSPEARRMRRRGVYARVIQAGTICVGNMVTKLNQEP